MRISLPSVAKLVPLALGPLRFSPGFGAWPSEQGMAWKTFFSDRIDWLRDTNAMLISACCHFTLLIVVALVSVAAARSGGESSKTLVTLGKGADGGESLVADDLPLEGEGKTADHSPL